MCIKDEHKYQAVIENQKNISTGQFTGATVFILVMLAIFGGWTTCQNRTEAFLACMAGLGSILLFFFASTVWYKKTKVVEECGRALEKKSVRNENGENDQGTVTKEQCCLFIMRERDEQHSIFGKGLFGKVNPWLAILAAIIWIFFTAALMGNSIIWIFFAAVLIGN